MSLQSGTPLPVGATITPGTLRARLEELRAQREVFALSEAIACVVPLCVSAAERHAAGEMLFVHPSSIRDAGGQWVVDPSLAVQPPLLPRDKSCMAPEERGGQPGTARSTVFSVAAILYEMLTAQTVGPGMRRPTEVDPSLPAALEGILSKALVADPAHRPDDLHALAQALHHLAPSGTQPPPPADESHLDYVGDLDVDVSMSLMPPAPAAGARQAIAVSPYDMVIDHHIQERPADDHTEALTALKARLEADTRPRYVVIKDGMDHGPFASVELLQQIASHTFTEDDYLRDQLSNVERTIQEWEEFAPFAKHARLNRNIKAEKEAIERTVVQERKSTASKAVIGIAIVGGLVAILVASILVSRGVRSDEVGVQGETAVNVESEAELESGKGGPGRGSKGGVVGTSGGYPVLGGGMSCEGAQAKYVESYNLEHGGKVPPDLTAGHYAKVLNRGSYLNACGVPDTMTVNVCAAVQNGRAVGVSVSTNPRNPGISGCIASQVRGMAFPSHPRLDVARTTFAAQ